MNFTQNLLESPGGFVYSASDVFGAAGKFEFPGSPAEPTPVSLFVAVLRDE